MPIRNIPFIEHGGFFKPILAIKIINPDTGQSVSTRGLVDTGADACAVPAYLAHRIGHDLTAVKPVTVHTGSGETSAYPHTIEINIFNPKTGELLYDVQRAKVDFISGLRDTLLGVSNFLDGFILNVNYKRKFFSIIEPPNRFTP